VFVFSDYWRSLALVCAKLADCDSLDKGTFEIV